MDDERRPMTDEEITEALLPLGRVLLRAMERYATTQGWDATGRPRPEVAAVFADVLTDRAPKALPAAGSPTRRRPRGQ